MMWKYNCDGWCIDGECTFVDDIPGLCEDNDYVEQTTYPVIQIEANFANDGSSRNTLSFPYEQDFINCAQAGYFYEIIKASFNGEFVNGDGLYVDINGTSAFAGYSDGTFASKPIFTSNFIPGMGFLLFVRNSNQCPNNQCTIQWTLPDVCWGGA